MIFIGSLFNWDGIEARSDLDRFYLVDNGYCFENHFIRGQVKMKMRVGLALVIMMAVALGHVKVGRIKQMRSLVLPIRQSA